MLEDVEHVRDGSVGKRHGHVVHAELATHAEIGPECGPIIGGRNDPMGTLVAGTTYNVVLTYATGACGETDALQQGVWGHTLGVGNNALDIGFPFNAERLTVNRFFRVPTTTPGLPPFPVGATEVCMISVSPMNGIGRG